MTNSTPSDVMTAIATISTSLSPSTIASALSVPIANGKGGYLHLTDAVKGCLMSGRNPFGLSLPEEVDSLAAEFHDENSWQERTGGQALGNIRICPFRSG